jgi:alanine-synthesizing transaminase
VYRAAGYRVGWVSFSGAVQRAGDYLAAVELLSSMRMCSNVPAQHAVHAALGGYQSILDLTAPGGRLHESRKAVINATARSKFLRLTPPAGALYAFVEVRSDVLPDFNDQQFALELLEEKHVLITPGTVFNVPYRNHFRTTILPDAGTLSLVFDRIEAQLESWSARHKGGSDVQGAGKRVVDASARFK